MTNFLQFFNTKNNSRMNYFYSRKKVPKTFLKKNTSFSSRKKSKKFESLNFCTFPLINKRNTKFEFEFIEGEKEVYLTGNFGTKKIEKNNIYFKFFNINKSFKKLKFKVKGIIKIFSIYYKNYNIFINKQKIFSKDYKNSQSQSTKDTVKNISLTSFEKNDINIHKLDNNINFSFSKKNYCNYYPKKDELNKGKNKLPVYFPTECYHEINHIQNNIGNKEYLDIKESNIFNSNNDSYKIIDKKEHLFLNHLCYKKIDNKIINSFIIRYRKKNTTFVYYK